MVEVKLFLGIENIFFVKKKSITYCTINSIYFNLGFCENKKIQN